MNRSRFSKNTLARIPAFFTLLALLLGITATKAAPENPDAPVRPEIVSIQFDGGEVVVTVRVPKGIKKVTLEGRPRLGRGNWTPRAIKRVDGTGGLLVFRLASSKSNEMIRVRGDEKETLPAAFYKGTTEFNSQVENGSNVAMVEDGGVPEPGRENDLTSTDEKGEVDGGGSREVVESDIWSFHKNKLYFFNQLRGLQVIDLTDKANPVIKGVLPMPASGEQMYMLGDDHVILLARDGCNWWGNSAESQAIIVNVSNDTPTVVGSVPVKGYIRESRLIGTALYIASQVYRQTEVVNKNGSISMRWEHGTQVSSFDVKNPSKPSARDTLFYNGYNNDIYATDKFLFVSTAVPKQYYKTDLRCIDISAPDGSMNEAATIRTAGRVADKFKMRLAKGTLTVISETFNRNGNNNRTRWETTLETFSLANPDKPEALGELRLAKGERLFATRFDADRVYIVTYERIDPLWIVDLSDPRKPVIKGELEVPGWSTYIQPLGDRLVSIGVDDTDNKRRVAVSLFDVSDVTKPRLFDKVTMGDRWSWSEAQYDEKAFTVLPHAGLILVPYQGYEGTGYAKKVQIIDLNEKTLKKRGVIEHALQPRRATEYQDFIMSISGQELLSVDATNRDKPVVKGKVELAWFVDQIIPVGDHLLQLARGSNWYFGEQRGPSLRVAAKADPDDALGSLILKHNAYLSGATVRGDKLYLLQTQSYHAANPKPVPEKGEEGDEENGEEKPEPEPNPNLFLTVVDLAKLPALSVISEVVLIDEHMGWNNQFKANWPGDGSLLWSNKGGHRYWGWPWIMDDIGGMPDIWWPGYGGGAGQLICFDVADPAKPALASNVNLSVEDEDENEEDKKRRRYVSRWNFSEAILNDNGLVYLSSQHSEYLAPEEEEEKPKDDDEDEEEDPDEPIEKPKPRPEPIPKPHGYWVTRYELHVVDYTDPADPVVRDTVAIPGSLIGTSHGGALLYTNGSHWNEERKWDGNWFDASSYDGLEAHLVDSIEQPNSWPQSHVVKSDGTLFLSFTERTKVLKEDGGVLRYDTQPYLQSFALDENGKFTLLDEIEPEKDIQQLKLIGGNLVGMDNRRGVTLFDTTDPDALRVAGKAKLEGCLWFNLENTVDNNGGGIWMPLGQYGAARIDWED